MKKSKFPSSETKTAFYEVRAMSEDVDAAGEPISNSNKWNAFQVRGLTFSVIYFIYLFSCAASVTVIKRGSGQF